MGFFITSAAAILAAARLGPIVGFILCVAQACTCRSGGASNSASYCVAPFYNQWGRYFFHHSVCPPPPPPYTQQIGRVYGRLGRGFELQHRTKFVGRKLHGRIEFIVHAVQFKDAGLSCLNPSLTLLRILPFPTLVNRWVGKPSLAHFASHDSMPGGGRGLFIKK